MSIPERQMQQTPSWKVNLTQKFNIFSQTRKQNLKNIIIPTTHLLNVNKQQNKQQNKLPSQICQQEFDKQLEQRLNILPKSKQLLSSNSKANKNRDQHRNKNKDQKRDQNKNTNTNQRINQNHYEHQHHLSFQNQLFKEVAGDKTFSQQNKQGSIHKQSIANNKQSLFDVSSVSNQSNHNNNRREQSFKPLDFSQNLNQNNQTQTLRNLKNNLYSLIFTNPSITQLFQKYFSEQQQQQISLQQFIDVCCLQFLSNDKNKISEQAKIMLVEQCRPLFCTTSQTYISLNAIQMLTKKHPHNLQLLIKQKILKVKYQKKKQKLQKQYDKILQEIILEQESIEKENQSLAEKKKQMQSKEKQLNKKQKSLKNQEKQLIQKQKYLRKQLEDKYNKLVSQLSHLTQKHVKEIQKKSSNVERNARNKMELIQKRVNGFRHIVIKNIPQKDNQQQHSKKLHNQILLYKSKLKKITQELQLTTIQKNKQIKYLDEESTNLLKANTILESKLQKFKSKSKDASELLNKKSMELQKLCIELSQKDQRIQQLQKMVLDIEHKNEKSLLNIALSDKKNKNEKHENMKKESIKSLRLSKKNDKKAQSLQTIIRKDAQQYKDCPNCKQQVQSLNKICKLIMTGFSQSHLKLKQQKQDYSLSLTKIQEVLLNQSQQIFIICSKFIWLAIENNISSINSILQFMINLFLAKLSFIKFQSINQISLQKNIVSTENFMENIQIQSFGDRSIEEMFKICPIYAQKIRQIYKNQKQQQPLFLLNLFLVFSISGLDQVYSYKKNKSVLTLHYIKQQLMQQIQSCQSLNRNLKHIKILKRFQEEQFMTFMFSKYLSYSISQNQAFIFIEILLELCNFYTLQNQNPPLFKTIFALDNYKCLFNFILINFSQQNVENDKKLREILQNISIVLQRFCYIYGNKINLDQKDFNQLQKLVKKLQKNKSTEDSLFKANLQNILQKIRQNTNQ